jgi:hypothetical protein
VNPTETAALIASASTVVAALGTQALNNRREAARRKAEVDQARIEEARQLYEQAAIAIHHALIFLRAARPEPQRAYNPEKVEDVAASVDDVDLIQTRLDVHVPRREREIGPWRNILSALSVSRKGLHDTLDQVRGLAAQTPTDKQVAMFDAALNQADSSSASFRGSVANAFRVSLDLHWTFRERLTRRWDRIRERLASTRR